MDQTMRPRQGCEATGRLRKADFLAISHPTRKLNSAFLNLLLTMCSSYYWGNKLPKLGCF